MKQAFVRGSIGRRNSPRGQREMRTMLLGGLVRDCGHGREASILIGARPTISSEMWRKARGIYELVLNERQEEWPNAVSRLCGGDGALESEVLGLLSNHDHLGSFLAEPAIVAMHGLTARPRERKLSPGTLLAARFKILRFLDSGRMGEVYEAWDDEVRDLVALKMLRPELTREPAAIASLREEVRQARRIAHPNICRVYDLFCHQGDLGEQTWFLTMQMLDGRTLLEQLRTEGPLDPEQANELIQQMISGLQAAHDLGIVHRDFKSSNIMLARSEGAIRAVITDFGLAIPMTVSGSAASTPRGQGTRGYAAPEQWRDGVVGPACDQYALGIVMCEMLSGERPASDVTTHLGSPVQLPGSFNFDEPWDIVIRRCLELKPEDRYDSVSDILNVLNPVRPPRRNPLWVTSVLVLPVLAAIGAFLIANTRRGPAVEDLMQLTPSMNLSADPSLSKDGKTIAYMSDRAESGNPDIWVQQLPDGTPTRITSDPGEDDEPSISPDGRTVVFTSSRDHGGVYLSSASGGGEKLLVRYGHQPKFSPDGQSIVYWTGDEGGGGAPNQRIYWLNLAGGTPVRLASDFKDAIQPIWSSDNRHVLFQGCRGPNDVIPLCRDWWVTSINGEDSQSTGAKALLEARGIKKTYGFAVWSGDTVWFSASATDSPVKRGRSRSFDPPMHLWELTVPPNSPKAQGEPKILGAEETQEIISSATLSADGQIAYTLLTPAQHIWRIDALKPVEAGRTKITQHAEVDLNPSVSHNGRWLTFVRGLGPERTVWLRDTTTGVESSVQVKGWNKHFPLVDDAGSTFVYEAWEGSVPAIFVARRGVPEVRLCRFCRNPTSWFNGTMSILCSNSDMSQVLMVDLATGQSRTVLSRPDGSVSDASWSPENQYVVFAVSYPNGKQELYAARFSSSSTVPEGSWIRISPPSARSETPRWSGDGRTLFFVTDRDSSASVLGQHFNPKSGQPVGMPFAVQHFYGEKESPTTIASENFNLSVAGNSIYLNVGEMGGTIWTGKLKQNKLSLRLF